MIAFLIVTCTFILKTQYVFCVTSMVVENMHNSNQWGLWTLMWLSRLLLWSDSVQFHITGPPSYYMVKQYEMWNREPLYWQDDCPSRVVVWSASDGFSIITTVITDKVNFLFPCELQSINCHYKDRELLRIKFPVQTTHGNWPSADHLDDHSWCPYR